MVGSGQFSLGPAALHIVERSAPLYYLNLVCAASLAVSRTHASTIAKQKKNRAHVQRVASQGVVLIHLEKLEKIYIIMFSGFLRVQKATRNIHVCICYTLEILHMLQTLMEYSHTPYQR